MIQFARERVAGASEKLENWKKLYATGVASATEGIRLQIEEEQARLRLAEAEGDADGIRQSLDRLVEVQNEHWKRARQLRQSGVVTGTEADAAEIQYLEARVQRARVQSKLEEIVKSLEQIADIKARSFEQVQRMVATGVVSGEFIAQAEADWKLAQAVHRAVANALNTGEASKSQEEDLNQIHRLAGKWFSDIAMARCAVCHHTVVEGWKTSSALVPADHRHVLQALTPDSTVAFVQLARDEVAARRRAAEQWKVAGPSPDNKRKLVRWITLDLTGRLPSPAEVNAFVSDDSPDALDRLVTRLTQSEQLPKGYIADGIFVPTGSTIFSRPAGARQIEIPDGTMNTIALVECQRDIPWTRPEEISFDPSRPESAWKGWHAGGWFAGMADGRVRYIPQDTPTPMIRALLTINGGEDLEEPAPPAVDVSPEKP